MSQLKKRENSPLLHLHVPFRPQRIGWCPPTPTLMRENFFTQPTNSNAKLFRKHSQIHSEIGFYQVSGHPSLSLIKLTLKIITPVYSFLLLTNIPYYRCTTVCLTIFPRKNILVISGLGQLQINLL